jgi:hypothetical protein
LRNGGSFAAGLWVLLLSPAALRRGGPPRALSYYGAFAGAVNIAALFGAPISFVVAVPWNLWIGLVLLHA